MLKLWSVINLPAKVSSTGLGGGKKLFMDIGRVPGLWNWRSKAFK